MTRNEWENLQNGDKITTVDGKETSVIYVDAWGAKYLEGERGESLFNIDQFDPKDWVKV